MVTGDDRPVLRREREAGIECADRELGCEQLRVAAADAEHDQRAQRCR
jgi:hypothetical protein